MFIVQMCIFKDKLMCEVRKIANISTVVKTKQGISACTSPTIKNKAGIQVLPNMMRRVLMSIWSVVCLQMCWTACLIWCQDDRQINKTKSTRMPVLEYLESSSIDKANLRDLIAVIGLVILLKLDSNRLFFSPCDLEIWWMTPKNNSW